MGKEFTAFIVFVYEFTIVIVFLNVRGVFVIACAYPHIIRVLTLVCEQEMEL